VIPVKHYQIETLLLELAPILSTETALLLLHNGMGGIELVQKYLPNNPLLVATTTDGVYKTSATCFVQTAIGQFDIGVIDEGNSLENNTNSEWEYLEAVHPHLRWRNDIVFALYQKLAVNAAINPLSALKNCKNGELLNYSDDIKKIKEETFDLYEFMNLPLDNHALSQHIDAVIQLTQDNYSSMHQDFHNGRKTEVEGILGFLLEKAKETGMKMPFIQTLYEQIKAGSN
jgi:2-dehydropantoate 2-reductase